MWAGGMTMRANAESKKPDYSTYLALKDVFKDLRALEGSGRRREACQRAAARQHGPPGRVQEPRHPGHDGPGQVRQGQELPRFGARHGDAAQAARRRQGRPQRRPDDPRHQGGRGRVAGRAQRARQAQQVRRHAPQDRAGRGRAPARSRCWSRRTSGPSSSAGGSGSG